VPGNRGLSLILVIDIGANLTHASFHDDVKEVYSNANFPD